MTSPIAEPGPGAPPFSPELAASLSSAIRGKPRTRHLRDDGSPLYTNRLALQSSPYLLQHAHNPVGWYPWGEEAFARARAEDKPVFLSVGYATCHWCHVMEEESFEDPEIARLMNELYVPVKVDREERPDVDAVYMQAVQLLTQHGGWPMSVFMTPDKKPFFGGTYFPPRDGARGARTGFRTILMELSRVYRDERTRAVDSAEQITAAVRASLTAERASALPDDIVLDGALQYFAQAYDPREGGVRGAPRFPSSLNIRFLLRAWKRTGDENALRMAVHTLEKMALGGIYDQIGGGFHRYSTDAQWLVPHFEKMLYDNALLVQAYVEAFLATRSVLFREVAIDILSYVGREMTGPGGAFWSATDADSEGEEGTFFVWTPAQLAEVLGASDGARAARIFQVTERGNFEGKSVLSLSQPPSPEERELLARVRPALLAARAKRPPPLTDTKVLTSWNGLMISAFARAGLFLDRPDFVERARAAAGFLLEKHMSAGKLVRTGAGHPALLEDYAFLAAGLVDLFEATGEARWLSSARELHATLAQRFVDPAGGFFRTPEGHEELLAREKPAYDGAEPTGNSVAALTLLRLAALTGDDAYRAQAEALLSSFGALLSAAPAALGEMLLAVDFLVSDPREIVLVRPRGGDDQALLDVLRSRFAPAQVIVRHEDGNEPATELARERPPQAGITTAYVCRRGACELPQTEPAAFAAALG